MSCTGDLSRPEIEMTECTMSRVAIWAVVGWFRAALKQSCYSSNGDRSGEGHPKESLQIRAGLRGNVTRKGRARTRRKIGETCGPISSRVVRLRPVAKADCCSSTLRTSVEERQAVLTVAHASRAFRFFGICVGRRAGWYPLGSAEDCQGVRPAVSRIRKTSARAAARP